MASVSWAARVSLLLVAVTLLSPAPASSQAPPGKNIANPDFPCGEPYGANGEKPSEKPRLKRQIIFPDDENYNRFLGILRRKDGLVDPRERQPPPADGDVQLEDAFCGAAVISDRFLVTSAHCVYDESNPVTSVRLGDIDISQEGEANSKPADYDIYRIIVHPGYKGETTNVRYNDLALLMTYSTIQFNDVVFPYCVPAETPGPGSVVTVSGYGLYNATTQSSHVLEANFTVLSTQECEDTYIREGQEALLRVKYPVLLQNTDMFCAIDDTSDSCQGDSGGPVILTTDGKKYLAGIVASGPSCRVNFKSILPGLYLSTARHLNFISDYVFGEVPPPE